MKKCNYRALAHAVVKDTKDFVNLKDEESAISALASIDKFVDESKKELNPALAKARKALIPLRNTLCGIIEVHNTENMSMSSTTKLYKDNLVNHCNQFVEIINGLTATAKAHRDAVPEYSSLAAKSSGTKTRTKEEAEELYEEAFGDKEATKERARETHDRSVIKKYTYLLNKIPRSIEADTFSIIRAPLLPIFRPIIFGLDDHLQKCHIEFDTFDMYFIIKNQVVMAINGKDGLGFVKESIKVINESGNTQYDLVTDVLFSIPGGNVKFAWLMEKSLFNKLRSKTNTFSISKWSFPVKITAHSDI